MAINVTLPKELIAETFGFLKAKDIALSCASTCKFWRQIVGENSSLWQCLLLRDFSYLLPDRGNEVYERAQKETTPATNLWRRAYILTVLDANLEWDPQWINNVMTLSDGNKTVHHSSELDTHQDMFVVRPFTGGIHRWALDVKDIVSSYWAATGVAMHPAFDSWSYGTTTFFGYSSVGSAQGQEIFEDTKELHCKEWESGGLVTLVLDQNKNTLDMALDGEPMPTLRVPADTQLYAWVNIFERLCPYPHSALLL